MANQTHIGFTEARREILAGRATAHFLWLLLDSEDDREGLALKPAPWEGPGEYQRVVFADGRDVLVRLPSYQPLPREHVPARG